MFIPSCIPTLENFQTNIKLDFLNLRGKNLYQDNFAQIECHKKQITLRLFPFKGLTVSCNIEKGKTRKQQRKRKTVREKKPEGYIEFVSCLPVVQLIKGLEKKRKQEAETAIR